jgi:hypothetical protein
VRIVGGHPDDSVARQIQPVVEDAHWRKAFAGRPYVKHAEPYSTYRPAYRHGWESRGRYGEFAWDEVEADVERDWETRREPTDLPWGEAREAVRDAWDRVEANLSSPRAGDEKRLEPSPGVQYS